MAHTNFRQGQPVFVHLKTGEKFKDKFFERQSKAIILIERGRVLIKDLRAVSVWRGK